MTVTDYPDWSSGTTLTPASRYSIDAPFTAPEQSSVMYMADYKYVHVLAPGQGVVGHYGIALNWFDAIGGVTQVGGMSCVTLPGGYTALKFPVLAPYLKVGVVKLDGAGTDTFILDVFPSNIEQHGLGISEVGAPMLQFQGNVGIGATQVINPDSVYAGPATFSVWQAAGKAWHANLLYYDVTAKTYQDLARLDSNNGAHGQIATVRLPPCPVQIQLTNDDVAVQFLNAIVCTGGG